MTGFIVDENLPPLPFWADQGFQHAATLSNNSDSYIWQYARENQLVIITKDSDFYYRHLSSPTLPKVVWLKTGNMKRNDLNEFVMNMWEGNFRSLGRWGIRNCVRRQD